MRKIGMLFLCLVVCGCTRLSDLQETPSRNDREAQTEDQKESTVQCTNDQNESLIFESKGDQIQKMTQKFRMSFSDLGIREDLDASAIQDKINESLDSMYKDLKGVSATGTLVDDHVEITVVIDYAAADDDELIEAGLLQEGDMASEYISLSQTQKSYESSGYTCQVD